MANTLAQLLSETSLGEPQVSGNLTLVPLLASWTGQDILPMSTAMTRDEFAIKEMEDGASVSEIRVENRLEQPVLLMEGEELLGALQNRVVNTTILIAPNSDTVIPVSCSEQGRWEQASEQFADSGVVAPPSIRAAKAESVDRSLRSHGSRVSDQSAVWDAIDEVASRAGTQRTTGAMRDVFIGRDEEIEAMAVSFSMTEGQVGYVALINGEAVGLDCVSSTEVLRGLHAKLIRGYALEAVLAPEALSFPRATAAAEQLLGECGACEDIRFDGVGLGMEHRYKGTGLTGSALLYEGRLVHAVMHRRSSTMAPTPFPRSYWVKPGQFLAGYYPGDLTKAAAQSKIGALLEAGIRCVINLVEEDERGAGGKPLRSYAALLTEEAQARQIDLTYLRISIPDVSVPSAETMQSILDAIDAAISRGQPVYVHCWGGRGRTGTVVGCYLVRHRIETGEGALAAINRLRRDDPGGKQSPETDGQRDMVRQWVE
jgi:hypothetical protein